MNNQFGTQVVFGTVCNDNITSWPDNKIIELLDGYKGYFQFFNNGVARLIRWNGFVVEYCHIEVTPDEFIPIIKYSEFYRGSKLKVRTWEEMEQLFSKK